MFQHLFSNRRGASIKGAVFFQQVKSSTKISKYANSLCAVVCCIPKCAATLVPRERNNVTQHHISEKDARKTEERKEIVLKVRIAQPHLINWKVKAYI